MKTKATADFTDEQRDAIMALEECTTLQQLADLIAHTPQHLLDEDAERVEERRVASDSQTA